MKVYTHIGFDPFLDPVHGYRVILWTDLNFHVIWMSHMKCQSCGTYSSQGQIVSLYKSMLNSDSWMWTFLWVAIW